MPLSHIHQQELAASAISADVIAERGYRTTTSPMALPNLFTYAQRERHGLLIPLRNVTGEIVSYQLKPDNPRTGANGTPIKYETASDGRSCLDVPARVQPYLRNREIPLWITEGAKKVDSALSHGFTAIIGLTGVENWSSEGLALPDWKEIALRNRTVVIAFDSDVMTKRSVRGALERFARWLDMQHAEVRYALLPDGPDGAKWGLDDWFAAGHTVTELEALLTDTLPGSVDDWEPPIPLDARHRPPFPADVLPGVMGAYVDAVAHTTQTPRDLPGCVALGAISAAAGGKFTVAVPELNWQEPVHIQTTPTLESGSRKSPVMAEMMAPIREWERARRKDDRVTLATWESQRRVKEAQLKKLEADLAKPPKPGKTRDEDLDLEIAALVRELQDETPPRVTQVIADDATPQSVAKTLHEQDGALAIVAPEDAFLANIAGKYSSGVPDLDVFLRGHNAEPIRTGRIGREGEDVPRACLTVCISPQPSVIARLGAVTGWISKGGSARLLATFPLTNVGRRELHPDPIPPDLREQWTELLVRLLELERQTVTDDDGHRVPHVLDLNPDASEAFHAFRAWCERQFTAGGAFVDEGMRSWGSKLAGHVLRLAGLLHIAGLDDPVGAAITGRTLTAAVTLGQYFLAHAQVMYDLMGGVGTPEEARLILDAIRDLGSPTTRHLLNRKLKDRRQFQKAASLDPGLTHLEDYGWIRMTTDRETGGRPTVIIHLNPLATGDQNSQKPPFRSFGRVFGGPANDMSTAGADEGTSDLAQLAEYRFGREDKSQSIPPVRTVLSHSERGELGQLHHSTPEKNSQNPQKPPRPPIDHNWMESDEHTAERELHAIREAAIAEWNRGEPPPTKPSHA